MSKPEDDPIVDATTPADRGGETADESRTDESVTDEPGTDESTTVEPNADEVASVGSAEATDDADDGHDDDVERVATARSGSTAVGPRRHRGAPFVHPLARLVLVGGVATGLVLGTTQLTRPDTSRAAAAPVGDVAVSQSALTCVGDPFRAQEGGVAADSRVGAEGGEVSGGVTLAPVPDAALDGLVERPGGPGTTALGDEGADSDEVRRSTTLGSSTVAARATGAFAPGLLATQQLQADGPEAHGLAATPCVAPSGDLWFIAGGGQPGRQERLVLANPGSSAVSADLTVMTPKGEEQPGAGQGVVVPPGGRVILSLDALAGTEEAQVVHVAATGGQLTGAVSDAWLDGLTPSGVELSGPTAAPAAELVIPGVSSGDAHGLVIGAPDAHEAVVEVSVVGADRTRGVKAVTVPAGGTAEVDLPEVDGAHAVSLVADVPVVASAWSSAAPGDDGVRDLTWSPATEPLGALGGVALPQVGADVDRVLALSSADPDGGPAQAVVLVRRGTSVERESIEVPPGQTRTLELGDADGVWVRPDPGAAPLHGGVLLTSSGGSPVTTSLPLTSMPLTTRDVPVQPVTE